MAEIEIEFYRQGKDVLLIFTGIGGTTKGFQNKYETIAKQVMEDYHFSVAVATTPSGSWLTLKDNLQTAMNFLFEKAKDKDFKVYTMGTSAGANLVLSFSYLFPQIKKILAINPVMNVNFHWIDKGIKNFIGEKINIVVGEKDQSSKWIGLLPKIETLKTTILPNIDHQFTDNLQAFIDLPKQYLFK